MIRRMEKLDISVVVPLYNEEESLPELAAWIDRVARANALSYELIFVDDGSSDNSWATVEQLKPRYPAIRGIRFRAPRGKVSITAPSPREAQSSSK